MAKASLGVRVPPLGPWGGEGETGPSPGAGSEVHAPGGLTDAREQAEQGKRRQKRCREGNRFFVSLLLLDFVFCLWIVKSCSGGPPTPAGDAHIHGEVLAARARWRHSAPEKAPGWLGHRLPVASSDEIFFFFFFLFHFVEIFTAMGEEEERGRGKMAP